MNKTKDRSRAGSRRRNGFILYVNGTLFHIEKPYDLYELYTDWLIDHDDNSYILTEEELQIVEKVINSYDAYYDAIVSNGITYISLEDFEAYAKEELLESYSMRLSEAKITTEAAKEEEFYKEIKGWYKEEFPNDKEGYESIAPNKTFYDLFDALDTYTDVYTVLGENADYIVRERAFAELAEMMGVDYGYIYNQWLTDLCLERLQKEDYNKYKEIFDGEWDTPESRQAFILYHGKAYDRYLELKKVYANG